MCAMKASPCKSGHMFNNQRVENVIILKNEEEYMLDLKIINKVNEVEKQTGQSLPRLLSIVTVPIYWNTAGSSPAIGILNENLRKTFLWNIKLIYEH